MIHSSQKIRSWTQLQNVDLRILNEFTPSQAQLINTIEDYEIGLNQTINSVVEICLICNMPEEPMTYIRCTKCIKYLQLQLNKSDNIL